MNPIKFSIADEENILFRKLYAFSRRKHSNEVGFFEISRRFAPCENSHFAFYRVKTRYKLSFNAILTKKLENAGKMQLAPKMTKNAGK